jgi:hypothetical protein
MGLAEILRALLLSDHAKLRDPEWVARAVAAVDAHDVPDVPDVPSVPTTEVAG